MTLRSTVRIIVALAAFALATLAIAHPAPFSYLDLHLDDGRAYGSLVIHDFDAAHELQMESPAQLLDANVARSARETLVAIIDARLQLQADGRELIVRWGDIATLPDRQSLRLTFELERPVASRLDLTTLLFPYDVNHQTFLNLHEDGELKVQAILDEQRRTLTFYAGTLQGRWAVVTTFVEAGIQHILIGRDHVLFLLGLMLLGGSAWRLATIVTAFTIGHSITLSLAALGLVQLPATLVEPIIALSIIVVGVDNLLVIRQRRGADVATTVATDLRPWLAGLFGLVHGFGFASVLVEFGLPREALGWSLAAFNIGVEIGQLVIVLAVIALARLVARLPSYRAPYAERFLTLASVAVVAAGVYWLAQRIGLTAIT